MRVADMMETRVEAADASTSAQTAWLHMRRRGLRLYVVMDASGIIGVVTREQLGGRGGRLNRSDRVLREFVKSGDIVTTAETPVRALARTLEPRIEGCLPVVQEGRLVGVLTLSHLLHVIARLERLHRPVPRRTRRRHASAPAAQDIRDVGPPHHGSAASARYSAPQHCCPSAAEASEP